MGDSSLESQVELTEITVMLFKKASSQPPATKCPKHGRRSHQGFQRLLETGHLHWCTPRRNRNLHLCLPTRTGTLGPPRPTRMERIPMVEHPKQELRLGRRNTLSSTPPVSTES